MMTIRSIKRTAAIVLFVTFFLPLSQCQKKQFKINPDGSIENGVSMRQAVEPDQGVDAAPEYSYNIAAKMFDPGELFSWLMLLSFVWPLLFWVWQMRDKRPRTAIVLNALEPIACIGSGYITWILSYLGDILIWGYLSMASVAVYFLLSCYELAHAVKARLTPPTLRSPS